MTGWLLSRCWLLKLIIGPCVSPGRIWLPVNYFGFNVGDEYVWAGFFDIAPHVAQQFVNMLTTIANAAHAKFGDLPAVVFLDFGNRHFKLMTNSCHQRFDDLPFIF